MRIAILNRHFSESRGGVERFCANLAREFVRAGHDVHVFAADWDAEPEGVTLHRVPMLSVFSWTKLCSFARNARKTLGSHEFDVVYALTQAFGGDIYRVGGLHLPWLAARHPNPLVRWLKILTSPVNIANLRLEHRIFSGNEYRLFVANSTMGKEHIVYHYGTPDGCVRVVHNGVDPSVFHPGVRDRFRASTRRELGIPDDVPVLLFLAANWKRKGLEYFLRALPIEENCRAVVVGKARTGPFERIAEQRALGDRVVFAGPTSEPVKYYAAADLFVLPTRYDPFANVCLEALACGVPVITSRENGAAELIEPGVNGYLLDRPGDVLQLREFIERFLRSRDRNAMRCAAARTGAEYTADRTACNTLGVFDEFIARARGTRGSDTRNSGQVPLAFALPPADRDTLGLLRSGKTPDGWESVRHSNTARVLRGTLSDGRVVYYKEFLPRNAAERWKSIFRGSRARRAQRGSALIRSKGLSAPATIIAGSLPAERSFLLSEAVPGEALEDYYRARFAGPRNPFDLARKREFIRELGAEVAVLHRRGIIHGDLRGYNVLVQESDDGLHFHFIDNERTRLSDSEDERRHNLVQIGTIWLAGLTISDRMRFFDAYREARPEIGPDWKPIAAAVHRATAQRLRDRGHSL